MPIDHRSMVDAVSSQDNTFGRVASYILGSLQNCFAGHKFAVGLEYGRRDHQVPELRQTIVHNQSFNTLSLAEEISRTLANRKSSARKLYVIVIRCVDCHYNLAFTLRHQPKSAFAFSARFPSFLPSISVAINVSRSSVKCFTCFTEA